MIDIYELVCHLCGLNDGADYAEVHEALYEKYEVDMDAFEKIIQDLLPLIDVGISPLTNTRFKGFSKIENGHGFWLARVEVNNDR